MIPENFHTIPRAASWNSEGEGDISWTGILKAWERHGGTQFGIPNARGVSALNFNGEDGRSFASL